MRLRIGLIGETTASEQIIRQLGCNYKIIQQADEISFGEYNALICSGKIADYRQALERFDSLGGAIIFDAIAYGNFLQAPLPGAWVKSLHPSSADFDFIDALDIYSKLYLSKKPKLIYLDKGLRLKIDARKIVLPFDMENFWDDHRIRRKKFPADRKELASERVAACTKGNLRKIIWRCLEILHDKQGLPLVQKWYFPQPQKTHFIFRVDTDFCSEQQANDLYQLCQKYKIPGTWFVDTQDFNRLENCYAKMEDQEVGLHCWHHLVFAGKDQNYRNLQKGSKHLLEAGIDYIGFAAPLGEWNSGLQESIVETGFEYSSEFGYDYDNFPLFPNSESAVMQIPIHPISTGRLRRSHFSIAEMKKYYLNVFEQNLANSEITIFYHHPSHPHLEVFEAIFKMINEKVIPVSSMADFQEWWLARDKIKAGVSVNEKTISIDTDGDIFWRIYKNNQEAIVAKSLEIDLDNCKFKPVSRQNIDGKAARRFSWRDLLYDYETARGKKYMKRKIKDSL